MLLRFLPVPCEPRASERSAWAGAAAYSARPPRPPSRPHLLRAGTLTWPPAITRPRRPSKGEIQLGARAHTHRQASSSPNNPQVDTQELASLTCEHKPCFTHTHSQAGLPNTSLCPTQVRKLCWFRWVDINSKFLLSYSETHTHKRRFTRLTISDFVYP